MAKKLSQKIISRHKDINPVILQLMYNRGVFNDKDGLEDQRAKIDFFLNPDYEKTYDPFLMKDMGKAAKRVEKALKNNEKIVIFGDYDADGVTSSCVLYETLKFMGYVPDMYIPHRDKEGYGLNDLAIDKFSKDKINLIITVDCGIRNKSEIKRAKAKGMDVIVTDHHEPDKKDLPRDAVALINPKQGDCSYPFKMLAGVGVAFKLAQAIVSKLDKSGDGEAFLKWLLDFVAIGSLGDMVPLLDENRTFVKFGSIVFDKTRRPGIIEMKKNNRSASSRFIDFFVAPRINAAGRMDHALWAFKLLTTESKVEAFRLLKRIEDLNKRRKIITEEIITDIKQEILPILPEEKLIFISKKGWSASVSGIVANRLVDEYNLPVFVSEEKGGLSKGSARSPKGISLLDLLSGISELFEKMGGHKNAAGFTFKSSNKDKIARALKEKADILSFGSKESSLHVDLDISPDDIKISLVGMLESLAPFGEGNPVPIFMLRGSKILSKKIVGSTHFKMWVENNSRRFEVIAFSKAYLDNDLAVGGLVDVIFRMSENEYRGVKSLQMELIKVIKCDSKFR